MKQNEKLKNKTVRVAPLGDADNIKNQKGITIVSLLITVILMLILLTVSINVALNPELFKTTQENAKKTESELEKEKAALSTGDIVFDMVYGETVISDELEVGDFVDYPIEYTNYATAGGTTEIAPLYSGWRVMSINEKVIKLISGGNPIQYGNASVVGLKNSADWEKEGFGPIYEADNFSDYIDKDLANEAHCMTLAEYKALASTHIDLVKDCGYYLVTVESPYRANKGIIYGMDVVLNDGNFMDYGNSNDCYMIYLKGLSDDTNYKLGVRVVVTLNRGITINEKEIIDGQEVWKIKVTE